MHCFEALCIVLLEVAVEETYQSEGPARAHKRRGGWAKPLQSAAALRAAWACRAEVACHSVKDPLPKALKTPYIGVFYWAHRKQGHRHLRPNRKKPYEFCLRALFWLNYLVPGARRASCRITQKLARGARREAPGRPGPPRETPKSPLWTPLKNTINSAWFLGARWLPK